MALPARKKLACVESYLDRLAQEFEVVTVGEHATRVAARDLPIRAPKFAA
jgi:hypothetical protein